MFYLFLLFYSYLGCSEPLPIEQLREQSRQIMKKSHCAKCHTPGNDSSAPLALKIFNLDQEHWTAAMSDVQLNRVAWSLKGATAAEIKAMGADPKENRLTLKEQKLILSFIAQELKHRVKKPDERFTELSKEQNHTLYMDPPVDR